MYCAILKVQNYLPHLLWDCFKSLRFLFQQKVFAETDFRGEGKSSKTARVPLSKNLKLLDSSTNMMIQAFITLKSSFTIHL